MSVSSEKVICGFLVQAKGQRSATKQGFLVSAKLRGEWRFKGGRKSIQSLCSSVDIAVICSTTDGVGLLLVVHLQHIVVLFNRPIGEEKRRDLE